MSAIPPQQRVPYPGAANPNGPRPPGPGMRPPGPGPRPRSQQAGPAVGPGGNVVAEQPDPSPAGLDTPETTTTTPAGGSKGGAARPSKVAGANGGAPGSAAPGEPRKYRYSTAQMNETKKWSKYAHIAGVFLLFLLIMIAMSMIFNHFFFSDTSDNGPVAPHPDENNTAIFPKDKQDVDSACGRSTFLQDSGVLCKAACVPQFFKCCDPFDEFILYNHTKKNVADILNSTDLLLSDLNATDLNATDVNVTDTNVTDTNVTDTNVTDTNVTAPPPVYKYVRESVSTVEERNVTFLDEYDDFDMSTCSFDQEVRGCMSYAKCQALAGQIDPAPANLPDMCALERLERDADTCMTLCRKLECCYKPYPDNCLAEKFDLCMDYAPCQNLRILQEDITPEQVLPTAPRELDYECAWGQPACAELCDKAACCSDPSANSCFSFNFMSCLTYSPCTANADTLTNITIPPQFSHVEKPPHDLIYACNAMDLEILEPTDKNCAEYCDAASCCSADGDANCFNKDPLGCLAWMAQCQTLVAKE